MFGASTSGMPAVPKRALLQQIRCFGKKFRQGAGTTDSPFKYKMNKSHINFYEKKKNFGDVLIFASVPKLLATAEEVMSVHGAPTTLRSKAFWEIFEKRTIQSAHLLAPLQMALLCRCFDQNLDKCVNVLTALAEQIPKWHMKKVELGEALAVTTLLEVFSRRLPSFSQGKLTKVCNTLLLRVPEVMYDLSMEDLITILQSTPKVSESKEEKIINDTRKCVDVITRLVGKRVAAMQDLEFVLAGQLASVFARHDVRDVAFFENMTGRLSPKMIQVRDVESASAVLQVLFAHDVLAIPPSNSFTIAVANVAKRHVKDLTAAELSTLSDLLTKLELDDAGESQQVIEVIKGELDARLEGQEK